MLDECISQSVLHKLRSPVVLLGDRNIFLGSSTQEKMISIIRQRPEITRKEHAVLTGLSPEGVKYHLNMLKQAGRIRHVGPTKKGYWEVLE